MSCNALDSSRADEPAAVHARARGERPANVHWHATSVSSEARAALFRYVPLTFWLTGLSGAGKSTIAYELEQRLIGERQPCAVLDGDNLRHGLNRDLGFSERDRRENMRRAAEAARLMNDAGLVVVASLVSPFREDRAAVKAIIGEARFVEVYVNTPLTVCESRDPKGLYRKARRGDIEDFTGVSSPYEPPLAPALTVDTASMPRGGAAAHLYAYLSDCSKGRGHDGGR